jgi:PTH1 family peptidyl-tRNA hydrolase
VVEALAKELDGSFSLQKVAEKAEVKYKGRTLILVKPTTYMNLSGKAVNYYLQQEKIPKENLVVITDDLALPFGKLRMKGKGSDGGHNGLKDIQATLNTTEYCRSRKRFSQRPAIGLRFGRMVGRRKRAPQRKNRSSSKFHQELCNYRHSVDDDELEREVGANFDSFSLTL